MFAGRNVHVTAVRRKSNNKIVFFEVPKTEIKWLGFFKKIPFLRGLIAIIEASAKGSRHLNFSAEVYAEDEDGESEENKEVKTPSQMANISMIISVAIVGVLSFLFGKFVFTLIPPTIEQLLFGNVIDNLILHNIIEGLIKLVLLLAYIYFISLTPMIKRLFQYHGAEHKVISAYEAGVELTVENVQKFSTLHYRCGSSFIVFTVIIGVFIYSFFSYETLWERLVDRILLLPVVIGVSYEFLRFTNRFKDVPVLSYLGYPGLWLQKLTTKEPTDDQVEVSIASFQRMLALDEKFATSDTKVVV